MYTPAMQRTAGATEAQYLFARYVFDELGYRRYEWKCNDLNAPSKRAARRFGFSFEGVFRQHMIVKGRNRDTAWFAMLDGEWPAPQGGLRALARARQFRSPGPPEDEPFPTYAGGRLMNPTIAEKRRRFAELHQAPGCFVMPNPFDVGSAKYLASLGFPALASTSAGMAFAAGLADGAVTRSYALKHIGELAGATDLPLNADFEAGFARDAEGVHESARLCIGAGVAGFSIEDYTGDPAAPSVRSQRSGRAAARGARGDQRERRDGAFDRAQ